LLYYRKRGGGLKPNPSGLSSFNALTLLVGSYDPYKPVPDMTYNVFGGTLNLAQSINYSKSENLIIISL